MEGNTTACSFGGRTNVAPPQPGVLAALGGTFVCRHDGAGEMRGLGRGVQQGGSFMYGDAIGTK